MGRNCVLYLSLVRFEVANFKQEPLNQTRCSSLLRRPRVATAHVSGCGLAPDACACACERSVCLASTSFNPTVRIHTYGNGMLRCATPNSLATLQPRCCMFVCRCVASRWHSKKRQGSQRTTVRPPHPPTSLTLLLILRFDSPLAH